MKNESIEKIKRFIIDNKVIILLVIGIITVLTIGSIAFYNIYIKKEPKAGIESADDFTKVEKEVINIKDDKTKLEKQEEKAYSEQYKQYEKLSDEEKKKVEVIPRKEEIPYNEIDKIKEDIKYNDMSEIPTSYNLKDYLNIEVENQMSYGLCWDFASLKSLETYMQIHNQGVYDFAEIHLDYMLSKDFYGYRSIHDGGNFYDFAKYSQISGAVLESDTEYRDYSEDEYDNLLDLNQVARATDVVKFPSMMKKNGVLEEQTEEELQNFRNVVKSHIMENGAIYAVILAPDPGTTYYNDKTSSLYYDGNETENRGPHAISIVGWDDNYSKNNFNEDSRPIHDGAYIALNSWGESFHENGYFYISYDDASVETDMNGVLSTTLDGAYKISDIKSSTIKDVIVDNLSNTFIDYNGESYVTKVALEDITSLDLSNKNLTSDDIQELIMFKNLLSLNLSKNNLTDISVLSNLKRLGHIDLSDNHITDITPLNDMDNLFSLYLSNNNIMDVSSLSNNKYLYDLNVSNNNGITGYEKLEQLGTLDLSNCGIQKINDLNGLTNLTSLDLSENTNIEFSGLIPTKINTIKLAKCNLDNLESLDKYTKLEGLYISDNPIDSLDGIESLESLSYLDISNTSIKSISNIKQLRKKQEKNKDAYGFRLIFKNNKINDITIFNDIDITSLDLTDNMISDISKFDNKYINYIDLSKNKNITGLRTLKNIRSVILQDCEIQDLKEVLTLTSVETLDLSNNNIINIDDINKLKKLTTLSLENNIGIKGTLNLDLDGLNLSNCDLDESFDLSNLTNLSYLNIDNNDKIKFKTIYNIINNSNRNDNSWIGISAKKITMTEKEYKKITKKDYSSSIHYLTINLDNISLNNETNAIDLKQYKWLGKLLMKKNIHDTKVDNGILNKRSITINSYDKHNLKIESLSGDLNIYDFDIIVNW